MAAPDASFGSPTIVKPPSSTDLSALPALAIDGNGGAMLASVDPQTQVDIMVTQYLPDGAWSAAQAVVSGAQDGVFSPVLAMNETGNAVLGFSQLFSTNGISVTLRRYASGR